MFIQSVRTGIFQILKTAGVGSCSDKVHQLIVADDFTHHLSFAADVEKIFKNLLLLTEFRIFMIVGI